MSDLAIKAEGVGKSFRLGQHRGGYELLSENLVRGVRSLGKRNRKEPTENFWALRDVGFEVKRGESFGIIGHNGAGKSTLLKILSRITPPTEGEIHLDGRVGALLEVGTGFHPELTGAENVYLNGAVLGLSKVDIDRRFDEIVEFAEVQRFIDTPVKRYSSGMYLRLAFAVAAHLEPEILIVDEVLSVGDSAFQRKCIGRMEDVADEGRTVLFVSHNLSAVSRLCKRSMLLSGGRPVTEGPTSEVIDEYVRSVQTQAGINLGDRVDRNGNGRMRFTTASFEIARDKVDLGICGTDLDLVFAFRTADGKPVPNVNLAVSINTMLGETMLHLSTSNTGHILAELPPDGQVRCHVPRCPLPPGTYVINLWADTGGEPLDWIEHAAELTVVEGDFYGTGRPGHVPSHQAILVDHTWDVEATAAANAR
jgi:homopolymeric O-antigen transport system ATP-binding protein